MILDVNALVKMGLDKPILQWMTLTDSPLKKHFLNIRDVLIPVLPEKIRSIPKRCCYVLDKNQPRSTDGAILRNPFITAYPFEGTLSEGLEIL